MRCDQCAEADALIHLTRIVDGTSTTQHLCVSCAAHQGITADSSTVEASEHGLFPSLDGPPASTDRVELHCPECQSTLAGIQASWRLGCPGCWVTFEGPLRELVRQVHGATRHIGKGYPVDAEPISSDEMMMQQRRRLHEALVSAVASERFEDAATIRDQLRTMGS